VTLSVHVPAALLWLAGGIVVGVIGAVLFFWAAVYRAVTGSNI
jgi:hypothetical protein